MLIIIGLIPAFIVFFIAIMLAFQGSLPAPVAAIVSGLIVAFIYWFMNGVANIPYL
ncbi:TPA: hypothetical protein ACUVPO_001653 [Campylobacter coli]|uniref:hypothetical protein n=1 Tax=Campylobacter coli TaxID=195 RepID=UPI003744C8AF